MQTTQAVHSDTSISKPQKLGLFEAIERIVSKEGLAGFWRGIGPALVLVINPVIQYTVFEQLKNVLVDRRTKRLPTSQRGVLNEWDFFVLGAVSKLGVLSSAIRRLSSLTFNSCHCDDVSLYVSGHVCTFFVLERLTR